MRSSAWVCLTVLILAGCTHAPKTIREDDWADYRKGYSYLNTRKDSAFFYFNRAATSSNDKEQVAQAFYNMAVIQGDAGDYYGAQESLIISLRSLDPQQLKEWDDLARDYNELGMTCFDLNNNRDALGYYRLALHYAVSKELKPYFLNNMGNSYQKLKLYGQALESYQKVIRIVGKTGPGYARTLTNMALTKWFRDRNYNAAPELRQALNIRRQENDSLGENSSYAHLADFYLNSRPDSGLYFARRMLAVAGQLQSPDDELEALQKLILLSPATQVKPYFRRYQSLRDSLETKRNAAKNQFALIRYNVEKGRTENLQLQKENTAGRYRLMGVLAIAFFGSLAGMFWYRKRKQGLQLEARQRELMLSQKVHDVVANGLYVVMSDLENHDSIQKGPLLDRIEVLYEQSRDISYERPGTAEDRFHEKIKDLVTAFAGPGTNVALAGNDNITWEKVNIKARRVLEQVLQELMVNMKKHSKATSVAVRFERQGSQFQLIYTDNGVGFPPKMRSGNGLTNTGNRIKDIGGTITFDTTINKGVKIYISLPLT